MSVPVMAPDNWLREPKEAEPEPARFMSDDEPEADAARSGERFYFSNSRAATVETTVNILGGASGAEDHAARDATRATGMSASRDGERNSERIWDRGADRAAENTEEQEVTSLPRDYAQEFAAETRAAAPRTETHAQGAPTVFPDPGAEPETDLDVPAFMRRLQF
jgi:hypothetical protein